MPELSRSPSTSSATTFNAKQAREAAQAALAHKLQRATSVNASDAALLDYRFALRRIERQEAAHLGGLSAGALA